MSKSIAVADLKPNPFRDMANYPIDETKVEALVRSIKDTSFWDNIIARKNEDNEYEIAYGHHRLKALKKARIEEITIPVTSLCHIVLVGTEEKNGVLDPVILKFTDSKERSRWLKTGGQSAIDKWYEIQGQCFGGWPAIYHIGPGTGRSADSWLEEWTRAVGDE